MPVNSQHPEYQRMAPKWKRMRDVAAGQDAVHTAVPFIGAHGLKAGAQAIAQAYESPGSFTVSAQTVRNNDPRGAWAGEAYLPRLHCESWPDYIARRDRAGFFAATWRTIAGLGGMLFRVDPVVKVSAGAEPMLDDVTKDGTDLNTLALQVVQEVLTVGRVGLMADFPRGAAEGATLAQVEALNLRPQLALYKTEAAINWRTSWINNEHVLSMVVLAECATLPSADEFVPKEEERWRVLDLVQLDDGAGGVRPAYRVRVFVQEEAVDTKGGKIMIDRVADEFFPLRNGQPLDFIPFQFIGVDDLTPKVSEPPLIDLANTNLSHYRTTADVEHGAHKTSLPQPWIAGIQAQIGPDGQPLETDGFYMGGGDAWAFPQPDTKVGMLEYTGQGLAALETRLSAKERQMAVLGARMLEDQKAGVESAQTAGIHRSGEQSALASQGATVSSGIERALGWFDAWAGGSGDVEFELTRDFLPAAMTPLMLTALVASWQSGAISKETLFDNLKAGELIRETVDFETQESQIANSPPALLAGAPAPTPTSAAPGGAGAVK